MIDAVGNPQSLLLLGGTSDIALATAEKYAAQRPLRIVLAARESERLDAAAERLRKTGSTVVTVPFEARKIETHAEVIDKAFAEGDIDITLVAFGVQGDNEQGWTDVETAREMAEVNYVAPMTLGVRLAEKLRKQGHGHLVVMSSPAAERARRSNFVYGSSKAGLDTFFSGLTYALDGSGVKVTVVRPNYVHTKLTEGIKPAPMAQQPEQVAEVIVDAVRKGKEQVWAPAQMRWVMTVLRHLPRVIFRRLPF
ncbi:decaprenylphospho-beta-D-erythro-pentofuranosid-2-ulose 2-reductase [Saccharopolyspora kobensis]|uniref:Decaprenylphospho-beta-D-erythro-pentofuranosid-2-ulose 2-reductase n=1 Tax=Saccharopolyspora kobensis TaxID=146035 RepID=A0A1H6DH23_9PSEU|nr:decaprenylphospho-beta-D-erythro-pentofuranosid-2-ulose 2-reductase [Saccharopolyspora kobensis]SEG83906.1 decaprenylphospho-beta-D-erythro-pentofuranosid-2-ulose 2-reductase [Saccharopolyspora kobensis]SFE34498.1 decaprenylphospho-beta-D-erythro-pentofuranosid-2-ulose 2-reductase [Saccharopolyspora kobensis]